MPWKAVKPGVQYVLRREHREGLFGKREEVLRLQMDTSRIGSPVEVMCYEDDRLAFYCLVDRIELSGFVARLASFIEGATPARKFAEPIFWQPMLVALSQALAEDHDLEIAKLEAQCEVARSELASARETEELVMEIKDLVDDYKPRDASASVADTKILSELIGHQNPETHEMVAWLYRADHIDTYHVESIPEGYRCTLCFANDRVAVIKAKTLRTMYTNAVLVAHKSRY